MFRVFMNAVSSLILAGIGVYLLTLESYFIKEKGNPEFGRLFSGWSLISLAVAVFAVSVLSAAVAISWAKRDIPLPPPGTIRPAPSYKGMIILKFWYLIAIAATALILAFYLSEKIVNPGI
ncbi:MAG TPA: hypothetical protein PKG52_06680 [bacterium]|nr:hypothetical protein [bacterium]HPS29361.1 hypothetical protein [bacterium]